MNSNLREKWMKHLTSRFLKTGAVATVISGAVLVFGNSVFAGLNATVSGANASNAGTLVLSSSNNGVGFSQSVNNLAPGDVVNRYITLTNSGTLDAQSLGLAVTATGTNTLISDGIAPATNKALTLAVFSCAGGTWNTTTGICSGTVTTEITSTTLADFASKKNFSATSTLNASGAVNLQMQLTLPDQNETTVNGVAPANTIQGGSVSLSYLFSQAQRTNTTTNS
jgi:hypothetical protein